MKRLSLAVLAIFLLLPGFVACVGVYPGTKQPGDQAASIARSRAYSYVAEDGAPVDAALAGDIELDPATPHSLGVRWPIRGDHNGNAVVTVEYRRHGEPGWNAALPLFWIHPDMAPPEERIAVGGRVFAGSIVDLPPDTAFEIKLELSDPDGGSQTRILSARTSQEPVEPAGMTTRYVTPLKAGDNPPGSGARDDPYRGLEAAVEHAGPGDLLILDSGEYRVGTLALARSGAPGRPIIFRADGNGPVVVDGGGAETLFDVSELQHIWFENLVLRGANVLVQAKKASHIVIRRNTFMISDRKLAVGIEARHATGRQSVGFFITDNTFVGPNKWPDEYKRKGPPDFIFALAITGSGHEVSYNLIRNVGDGINNGRGGRLSASDIHNNEIVDATDDCIEADHSGANLRVYRNRLTNCFAGISVQPAYGGPVYLFRNLILNTQYSPFKLHNDTSGVLIFHNTSVRSGIPFHIRPGRETVNDVITRNNVFVGTKGPALRSTGRMIRCDFDNDGFGWMFGGFSQWNRARYGSPLAARESGELYWRSGAFILRPGTEFASMIRPPSDPANRQHAAANDLRLAQSSRAIDKGVMLPNFNDGYSGDAPDLGCCEFGAPLPRFGPRKRAPY